MKMFKLTNLLVISIIVLLLSSCTYRLVDFTVISSKNVDIGVDRTKGVQTEGKKSYFLGFGWNIKDALDIAIETAGPEYDMLIDGVVTYSSYPFVSVVEVKGVAVKSVELKAALGEKGFENWCRTNNVFDPKTAEVISD
jgi:hypothetical protein